MGERECETCLAWVKRHQDSAYGFCYLGPQAVERHWNDWCLQWQERGIRDPRIVVTKRDPSGLVCPDCHGPIEDIGQEGSLTVWQCRECERVTTSPVGVTQVFYEDSGPEKFLYRNSEEQAEAPRPISSCVYAVQDDGIAKGYLFATREIAHEWLKREEKREHLEGCTIERYTLWHEAPPPECSWCDATGDLTSVVWKGEDLLLCKACLAKCTGKAASDE